MSKSVKKKKVIGITGGFATGKTMVADMLSPKGALKIDADKIGHRILKESNSVRVKLVDIFGEKILTEDKIDREKLKKVVFFDAECLEKLNNIVHPVIIASIRKEINDFNEGTLLIDAPLLIEAGLCGDVDIVVVVTANHETQVNRACERGFTEEEAKKIIAAQMPLSEKIQFADHLIDNDGDINKTKEGVEELWNKIKNL